MRGFPLGCLQKNREVVEVENVHVVITGAQTKSRFSGCRIPKRLSNSWVILNIQCFHTK
jgi:hypothetical protein